MAYFYDEKSDNYYKADQDALTKQSIVRKSKSYKEFVLFLKNKNVQNAKSMSSPKFLIAREMGQMACDTSCYTSLFIRKIQIRQTINLSGNIVFPCVLWHSNNNNLDIVYKSFPKNMHFAHKISVSPRKVSMGNMNVGSKNSGRLRFKFHSAVCHSSFPVVNSYNAEMFWISDSKIFGMLSDSNLTVMYCSGRERQIIQSVRLKGSHLKFSSQAEIEPAVQRPYLTTEMGFPFNPTFIYSASSIFKLDRSDFTATRCNFIDGHILACANKNSPSEITSDENDGCDLVFVAYKVKKSDNINLELIQFRLNNKKPKLLCQYHIRSNKECGQISKLLYFYNSNSGAEGLLISYKHCVHLINVNDSVASQRTFGCWLNDPTLSEVLLASNLTNYKFVLCTPSMNHIAVQLNVCSHKIVLIWDLLSGQMIKFLDVAVSSNESSNSWPLILYFKSFWYNGCQDDLVQGPVLVALDDTNMRFFY